MVDFPMIEIFFYRELINKAAGARDELRRLVNDLRLLKAFDGDTARKQVNQLRGLDLERQIKEVVYAIEDTLEYWLINEATLAVPFLRLKHWVTLAMEIESIRDGKLEPLYRRIEAYGDLQVYRTDNLLNATIEKELERQRNYINHLRAFLREAMMQKQSKRSRDPDLERQIKELIYDIKDIHESWLVPMAEKNTESVAREINSIRNLRLDPILHKIRMYTDQHKGTEENEVLSVQLNNVVDFEKELEGQKNDVSLLRTFLRKSKMERQSEGSRDLDLERQIKELIYDIEDIHESWLTPIAAINTESVAREIISIRNLRLDPMLNKIRMYTDRHVVEYRRTKANEVPSVQLNNVGGFVKELERQRNDISHLRDILREAMMERQSVRSRDPDLERQIKELIYDIEDIHESWLAPMAEKNTETVAREIESIRNLRLDPMLHKLRMYTDRRIVEYRRTKANEVLSVQLNVVPTIGVSNMVGFEDDAKSLINCLVEETDKLDVVSITGMPGIGKTTLAWKIYQDQMIQTKFPTRIWVDIPLDFLNKDLYVNILKEFLKKDMIGYQELVDWLHMPQESSSRSSCFEIFNEYTEGGRINDHQLIHAIRACLEKNPFLLVMDSVWTVDALQSLKHFLPDTGKVLITSRNNNIMGKSHVLRFLNEEESWDLLQFEVFGKLNGCPEMLRSTGKLIAKNCDGSPLTISVVASRLMVPSSADTAMDLTKEWWNMVSLNVIMYITEYGAQHNVFKSVELSYTNLPLFLRNCFLYFGVFPEGHEIPVWTLTRLWIAEGLVPDNWGLCLEDGAERILRDLINRNLVMIGKIYPNGNIKTCRLHKLIYGFCKYKAAEQAFYQELSISKEGVLDCPKALTPSHRRLCMYSCLSEFLTNGPKGPCVRSIVCFDKEEKVLHSKHSSNIHKSFKLLKIFECRGIKFTKFPTRLSRLKNLRHISLSCDSLDAIPKTISSLCYLETLVVETNSPSLEVRANIWRMFQLRHLVTKASIVLAVRGKGKAGERLQTLTRLAPQCCTKDVFTRAPNLKTLGIRGQLVAFASPESLGKLEYLQHLKLINESDDAASDNQLLRLPGLIDRNFFPPNIRRLTLSATHLEWEKMSVVGKIHHLEILKLKNNAFTGKSWINTNADLFRHLGFLFIGTTNLVSWEASADCFPSLKCLVLKNCEKLLIIPSSLEIRLDTFDVVNVPNLESSRDIRDIDDLTKNVEDNFIALPFIEQPHPDAQLLRQRKGKGILVEPNKYKPVFPVKTTSRGGIVIRTTPPSSPPPAHLTGPATKPAELIEKLFALKGLQPDQPAAQQPSVPTMSEVSSAQAPKTVPERTLSSQIVDQDLKSTERKDDDGSDEVDENILFDQPMAHNNLKRTSLEEEDVELLPQTRANRPSFEKPVCPNPFLVKEVEFCSEEDLVKAAEKVKAQAAEQTSSQKERTEKAQDEKKKSEAAETEKAKHEKDAALTVERAMQRADLGSLLAAENYSLLETDMVTRRMDPQLVIQMRNNWDAAFTTNEVTFAKMMAQEQPGDMFQTMLAEFHDGDIRYTNQCHEEEQIALVSAREAELAKAQAVEASMSPPLALANGQPTQHAPLNDTPISSVHHQEVEKDEEGEEMNQDQQLVVRQADTTTQIRSVLTKVEKIESMIMCLGNSFNSLSDVVKKGEEVRKSYETLLRANMEKIQAETSRRDEEAKLAELRIQQAENASLQQVRGCPANGASSQASAGGKEPK